MSCLRNTKLYSKFKCTCESDSSKDLCSKHPKYENIKSYQNYSSPFRTPIDIKSNDVILNDSKMITFHYKSDVTGHYYDTGSTIEYDVEDEDSYVTVMNEKYILKQFHFHATSEHTIDGTFKPMEMHFVHENYDCKTGLSKIVAVGLLLNLSNNSETLSFIKHAFDKKKFLQQRSVNLSMLNDLTAKTHYYYLGSLTSPPFDVYFKWFMFENFTITDDEYRKFLGLYSNNRYPITEYNENRYSKPLQNNFLAITKINVKECEKRKYW